MVEQSHRLHRVRLNRPRAREVSAFIRCVSGVRGHREGGKHTKGGGGNGGIYRVRVCMCVECLCACVCVSVTHWLGDILPA